MATIQDCLMGKQKWVDLSVVFDRMDFAKVELCWITGAWTGAGAAVAGTVRARCRQRCQEQHRAGAVCAWAATERSDTWRDVAVGSK